MEEPVCRDFIVPTLFAAALDDMRAKKITKKSRERRFRRPRRLRVRTAYLSLGTRWAQFLGRLSASSSRRRFVFSHILYPGDERLTRLALVKKLALVLAPFLRAASAAFRARRPATLKCIVVVRRGKKRALVRLGVHFPARPGRRRSRGVPQVQGQVVEIFGHGASVSTLCIGAFEHAAELKVKVLRDG